MALRSTADRYGAVAVALHWASAAAILVLLPLGFLMQGAEGELRVGLYRAHLALGLLVLALTLLRVFWRLALERGRPGALPGPALQARAAKVAHGLLYLALVLLSVSGIGMTALSGAGSPLFEAGIAPAPGAFDDLPPRALHGGVALVLCGLLALHVAAALWHHVVRREETLARMLPERRSATKPRAAG